MHIFSGIGITPTHGSWAQESLRKRKLIIPLGEKFRERLDHLEALAASTAQSHAIDKTPAASAGPSEAVTTHALSSTLTRTIA